MHLDSPFQPWPGIRPPPLFWSCSALVLSVVCVLLYSLTETPGKIVVAVVGPLLYLVNVSGLVWLGLALWTAHGNLLAGRKAWGSVGWRALHVIDHFIGFNISYALLMYVLWAWDSSADKSHFFIVLGPGAQTSAWAAWVGFLNLAFLVYRGVGFSHIVVQHWLTDAVSLCFVPVAWLFSVMIEAIVLAELYQLAKTATAGRQDQASPSDEVEYDAL